MINGIQLNYNKLREINPQAAREVILEMLETNRWNISKSSRDLNTTRNTIKKIQKLNKQYSEDKVAHFGQKGREFKSL